MKTEKRKLKGSVLFTVVSVLSIMIIFMTCTLAMAAAANKRSKKTYSSSQSTYTARTAIDSMLAAVGTSKDFSKAIRSLNANDEMSIVVDLGEGSLGRVSNAKIKNIGTKTVYDPDEKDWVERNLYSLSCDVTIGGETTTITSRVMQDPPVSNGTGGGAGFLTYGSAHLGTFTSIWGGAYVGMGEWDATAADGTPVKKNWNTGDLQNLYEWQPSWMPDGVTCDIEHSNLYTPLDHRHWSGKKYNLQNDNTIETPMIFNGSFNCENILEVYFTQKDKSAVIWGDFNINNGGLGFNMSEALKNDINNNKVNNLYELPFMYIDGKLKCSNMLTMNNVKGAAVPAENHPVNVFCGSLELTEACNKFEIWTDLYCMDKGADSVIKSKGTALYNWSNSVMTGTSSISTVGGSLYSNGNLKIDTAEQALVIKGDLRVAGNLEISNTDVTVEGCVAVGGAIVLKGGKNGKGKLHVNDKFGMTSAAVDTTKSGPASGIYADKALSADDKNNQFTGSKLNMDGVHEEVVEAAYVKGLKWMVAAYNPAPPWCWCDPDGLEAFINTLPASDRPTLKHNKVGDHEFDYYDFGNYDYSTTPGVSPPFVIGTTWGDYEFAEPKNLSSKYVDDDGNEVALADKIEINGDLKFENKHVYGVNIFTNKNESIYPDYATRESLLGISWPVEGMEKGEYIKEIPSTVTMPAPIDGSAYGGNTITNNAVLTGLFTTPVNIEADGKVIYVQLSDFSLEVSDPTQSKLNVKTKNGGKVYFSLSGDIENNYQLDDERKAKKRLKTVYEYMSEFKLEDIKDAPSASLPVFKIDDYGAGYTAPTTGIDLTSKYPDGVVIKGVPSMDKFQDNNNAKFTVTPGASDYWIVLEGPTDKVYNPNDPSTYLSLENVGIEVDDTNPNAGMVKIFIKGNVAMKANSKIITKKYRQFINKESGAPDYIYMQSDPDDDNLKPPTISGKTMVPAYIPNIEIYSTDARNNPSQRAKLILDDDVLITGYIRAPYLDMETGAITEKSELLSRIYYDGVRQDSTIVGVNRFAVLGCMNVGEAEGGSQPMRVLYINRNGNKPAPITDAEGRHQYESVEYMAYQH